MTGPLALLRNHPLTGGPPARAALRRLVAMA